MTVRWFFALTVVGVGVVFLLPYIIFPHPRQKPFDLDEWTQLSNSEDGKAKRGGMADDLINNHLKKGISRGTVMSILGNPDSQTSGGRFRYYLGWYKSFMDPESLVVCFSENGRLAKTLRWQH